ncbi:MAG: hypothetical protein WA802_04210 [Terracidiphilus sp.]
MSEAFSFNIMRHVFGAETGLKLSEKLQPNTSIELEFGRGLRDFFRRDRGPAGSLILSISIVRREGVILCNSSGVRIGLMA